MSKLETTTSGQQLYQQFLLSSQRERDLEFQRFTQKQLLEAEAAMNSLKLPRTVNAREIHTGLRQIFQENLNGTDGIMIQGLSKERTVKAQK